MKRTIILSLLLCILAIAAWGCAKDVSPLDEPLCLDSFYYSSSGSSMGSIYSYRAEKTPDGAHIYIELNCGRYILDTDVTEDVLGRLGEIGALHRLDLWDGFKKSHSNVSDGTSFALSMEGEGLSVYAKGSNAFPDRYSDAKAAIDELFMGLVGQYGELPEGME